MPIYRWLHEDLLALHPDLHVHKNLKADLFTGGLKDFYRTAVSNGLALVLKNLGFDSLYFQVGFQDSPLFGPIIDVTWCALFYKLNVHLTLESLPSYAFLYEEFCVQVEGRLQELLAPNFGAAKNNKQATVPLSRTFFYVAALLEGVGANRENWPVVRQAYLDYLSELLEKGDVPTVDLSTGEIMMLHHQNNKDTTERDLIIEPKTVNHRKE